MESKDALEQRLWNRNQELFTPELDLVLLDTTNTYVHGRTRGRFAQFGPSKEKRFDRRLVSIGLLATRDGVPIGHEVFRGTMGDPEAFVKMLHAPGIAAQRGGVIVIEACPLARQAGVLDAAFDSKATTTVT